MPSRGMTPSELSTSTLWRHGPTWLVDWNSDPNLAEEESVMPEVCAAELNVVQPPISSHVLLSSGQSTDLTRVIKLENFSKLGKLLRVTAYVLRFLNRCKSRLQNDSTALLKEITASEVIAAENLWVRESLKELVSHKNFSTWKTQFGLFLDGQRW